MRVKRLTEQVQKPKRGGSKPGRKIVRMPLTSLAGLIKEAARVYARVKDGKMPHEEGRSLVWILAQMRAMVEAEHLVRIEAKLTQLSETAQQRGLLTYNGHQDAETARGVDGG